MVHNKCPLCSSLNFYSLKNYEKHFLHYCHSCGFVFSNKIPELSELEKHYTGYGNYADLSDITIKRYNELLVKFSNNNKCNNILDFGCGEGFFLEIAKHKGWNVFGIEYDKEAIKKCRAKGITMLETENHHLYGQFDVVYISEVIEHVSFPLSTLSLIQKLLLRKGGVVYITTPNFNSISRFYVGNKWNIITYPEHLSYFTLKTLKRSLKTTGFKVQQIKTQGISITRIKKSISIGKKNIDKPIRTDEKIRQLTEKNSLLNNIKGFLNFMLRITFKGDTIKCFAVKIRD